MVWHFSGSNLQDRYTVIPGYNYSGSPEYITRLDYFSDRDIESVGFSYFAQYWTYHNAEETGVHTFYLICNLQCSLQVTENSCDLDSEKPVIATVKEPDIPSYYGFAE